MIGLDQTLARLKALGDATQTREAQRILVDALEPVREAILANIHSISGRTAAAVKVAPGAIQPGTFANPTAFLTIDRKIAFTMWKGKRFAYPYSVEVGHGGPHAAPPHPFFLPPYQAARAEVRARVIEGFQDLLKEAAA